MDEVFALVEQIYGATVEPELWGNFLYELSAALGGAAGMMRLRVSSRSEARRIFRVHLRPELESVYARYCAQGLPWSVVNGPPQSESFVRTSDIYADAELARSDFYAEWMKPQELAPEGPLAITITARSGRPTGELMLFRRMGGRPIDASDVALCETLAPHLRRARYLSRRFGSVVRERLAFTEVINRLPVGIVLINRRGVPVITNRCADSILGQRDGLKLAAGGLRAANRRDDAVLQQLLADAIDAGPSGGYANRVMAVSRPSGKRSFPVIAASLAESLPGEAAEDAVACALIGDPETGVSFSPEALRIAYSLTPAESELLGLLASGHCLSDAAKARGVSLNTVRSQLKQVFAKTDTSRQAALIRLVLTGAAAYPDD